MADNRTMAQMLQAPIEGYEDAIVVPPINANNFKLKQPLINLVQSNKFTDNYNAPSSILLHLPIISFEIATNGDSFEFQQLAASLEDKMDIRMSRLEKMISEKNATTPATVKAVEEVCVTCGSNHNFNNCPVTESANTIKSSVDYLVPTPSESADLSDGESECDVPINDDSPESHFSTFDNPLFDSNDDFSSDDESLFEEEIEKDEFKYFSNPLYDLDDEIITNEKILPNQKDLDVDIPIPPGIDKPCFNAESDLLESLLNRDSPIDSTKIDSIFDEFSLPRPPDATIESLSPSLIPVEDNDPFMEEIDIFLASNDSTPPGVESDYDSEGDILSLEELLNNDSVPLAEYNQFTFDIPIRLRRTI
ncbi:hypothetical protein Tco_0432910 [Tanacetum coccineum]